MVYDCMLNPLFYYIVMFLAIGDKIRVDEKKKKL